MQQPNFTPGPWEVVNSDFFNDNADSSLVIRDGEDWEICHLCDGIRGDFETMAFNAALIAAAPAMYAKLQELSRKMYDMAYHSEHQKIEAILARARGENPTP